jgi:hypothetical protein
MVLIAETSILQLTKNLDMSYKYHLIQLYTVLLWVLYSWPEDDRIRSKHVATLKYSRTP